MAFRYPTGARVLLVEETARRRRIESRVVAVLEGAGFAEVVLPIIDFAEPYAEVTERDAARQSYRFTDRDGELVAIRSDFTPMVARALAPSLSDLPLRVFYRGDVIRCEASRLGANRELFQIGAELIGDGSTEADEEMLQLVSMIASELVSEPLIVHTGGERASRPRPSSVPLDGIATAGTAAARGRDARSPCHFLMHDGPDDHPGYYTGLRFWVYGGGRRVPFAQGGRYDSLYGRFGTSTPAIGFTFTIDDLED